MVLRSATSVPSSCLPGGGLDLAGLAMPPCLSSFLAAPCHLMKGRLRSNLASVWTLIASPVTYYFNWCSLSFIFSFPALRDEN